MTPLFFSKCAICSAVIPGLIVTRISLCGLVAIMPAVATITAHTIADTINLFRIRIAQAVAAPFKVRRLKPAATEACGYRAGKPAHYREAR